MVQDSIKGSKLRDTLLREAEAQNHSREDRVGDGKEQNSHSTQKSSEQPETLLELGDSTEGSP